MVVLVVAADNAGTNGADSITTASDAKGHTYTARATTGRDPGAANAGCTVRVFTATVGSGGMASTDQITVNFSPNTTSKAAVVWRVTGLGAPEFVAITKQNNFTNNPLAETTGTITDTHAVICGLAVESNGSLTFDSDTTNGTWTSGAQTTADTGTSDTSIIVGSQCKIVTATATQTWNVTLPGSRDWALAAITVKEGAVTGASVTPSVVTATSEVSAPTVTTGAGVTPGVVTATSQVPAPTIGAVTNATITPAVVTASSEVPAPSLTAVSNATVSPAVVTVTSEAPVPTLSTGVSFTAPVVTAPATIGEPGVVNEIVNQPGGGVMTVSPQDGGLSTMTVTPRDSVTMAVTPQGSVTMSVTLGS
jgi:hypothetical protein